LAKKATLPKSWLGRQLAWLSELKQDFDNEADEQDQEAEDADCDADKSDHDGVDDSMNKAVFREAFCGPISQSKAVDR